MPSAIPAAERAAKLGAQYAQSKDTAFATSGDGTGFHLLLANEANGYQWKTAATLREDGFDADSWIGNACLTASGKYAAVAYAPRTFTNKPELMVRGAFTALVDLASGKVTKLPQTASLAYFSPGCGNGDEAIFTQLSHDGDKRQQSRLVTADAKTGQLTAPITVPGQVTSAVPTKSGIIAAHGNRLVRLNGTRETELLRTRTVPFQLTVDADGGVTYIEREKENKETDEPRSWARHLTSAKVAGGRTQTDTVASGKLGEWDLASTPSGRVFITGKAVSEGKLPARIANPGGLTEGVRMSSLGHAAVSAAWADGKTSMLTPKGTDPTRPARAHLKVLATNSSVALDVTPRAEGKNAETGTHPSPALGVASKGKSAEKSGDGRTPQSVERLGRAASPTGPSEDADERYCAVARNDPKKQAFQPTPRQIEWAVDQAVIGNLTFNRPANWKNTGMDGYSPNGLFPPITLAGDPNATLDNEDPKETDRWHIPSQVMLGVTAQETNMWQATRYAVPGVTANSLVGNFYGTKYAADGAQADPWRINFSDADCGYGITQATDGMRLAGKTKKGETALPPDTQEAVALDYAANIAYGAQILSRKWDETYYAGMKVNGGHPQWIENWFFALWAYNSGFYSAADSAGHKGLGWTNNPANPLWKANRTPFLENAGGGDDYSHAAHPQDWPYQEKVLGWAARPISAMSAPGSFGPGYLAAWWNGDNKRTAVKPPIDLFCDSSNNCDPSKISNSDSNDPGQGACKLDAGTSDSNPHWLHCWWDKPAQWKDCEKLAECGHQVHRFNTSYPEQPDANSYPPRCSSGLPANALIVDDLPNGATPTGSASRGCGPAKSDGTFNLTYQPSVVTDAKTGQNITTYPGKIDTHQIGAAYGNHFWFTHTRSPEPSPQGDRMKVTGTWSLGRKLTEHDGQAKVYVFVPDHGAQTGAARYKITTSNGVTEKVISQKDNQSNKWVDLGAYSFGEVTPKVTLDNFNGGNGSADIAFDAVAFVPGDYWGLPTDLAFSDPTDESGPDPEFPQMPQIISGHLFWKKPVAPRLRSKAVGPVMKGGVAPAAAPALAAADEAGTVSCALTKETFTYDRTSACIVSTISASGVDQNKKPVSIDFNYRQELKTSRDSKKVTQKVDISVDKASPNVTNATINVDFHCRIGLCKSDPAVWSGSKTFTGASDLHHLTATQTTEWTGTGKSNMQLSWSALASINGMVAPDPLTAGEDELEIRCDDQFKNKPAGCVFPRWVPTYTFSESKYPAAAAHIWMLQHKLPSHFGLKGQGSPLNFLANDTPQKSNPKKMQKDFNRDTVCPDGWAKKFSPTLVKPGDIPNCDEFTFAATYQSGGMQTNDGGKNPKPVTSGDECISTVTMKDPDGKWRLHPAPGEKVPTWTETCGRSSMSGRHNQGSMNRFGTFMYSNRLLDGDQYWLDVAKPQ
ncbi:hypothetical protein ACIO3O_41975 [Streptomyces sp. NPDC087440]|uniref:golvesin C-terminal-like domain-containing protein n=1 Tax=Streptomyces sp. NPDC087440 TaxID=3365790 RepID=UPI003803ACC7